MDALPSPTEFRFPTVNGLSGHGRRSSLRPASLLIDRQSKRLSRSLTTGWQMTPPVTPLFPREEQQDDTPVESPMYPEPVNFHSYLRAFYPFHPASTVDSIAEEESITLPINQGDVILVHSIQPNGWADGTLLTSGARGWLPTNYCEAYDHDAIVNLLNALTYVWEFIRGHEDDESSIYARQDYVRGMIAGVRVFLERSKCLSRDSPLVQGHVGIRRMRKGLLGDLSSFVKAAKLLQDVCHEQIDPEALYSMLDDIVLKAFKVVTRAVRFLDIWTQDAVLKNRVEIFPEDKSIPLTPPAESQTTFQNSLGDSQQAYPGEEECATQCGREDAVVQPRSTSLHVAGHEESDAQPTFQLSSRPTSTTFVPTVRPLSIAQKRTSASHRLSYSTNAVRTSGQILASDRLSAAHDAFLGFLGAFIGLHLQSRSSMDLLLSTQQSVASCQSLLAVVEEVWERDCRRSDALNDAQENMHAKLSLLVQATRDIFKSPESCEDGEVFTADQGNRLVDAATLCVRAVGECVAKTKTVIERIGDFDFESPVDLGFSDGFPSAVEASESSAYPLQDMAEEIDKPLPLVPQSHDLDAQSNPPEPNHLPPSPPPTQEPQNSTQTLENPVTTNLIRLSSLPRSSCETVVPSDRSSSGSSSERKPPSLDIDIPVSDIDFINFPEPPRSAISDENKSFKADSVGISLADSSSGYLGSFRNSESSFATQPSTRATTPDNTSEREQHDSTLTASFNSLNDDPLETVEDTEETEAQVLAETYAHQLVFNKDGQITGGSLPALVERLTTHDSTPDAMFVNTFHLTFRLFTAPAQLAQALVDRFDGVGEGHEFSTPVRLRVYNVIKGWLESYWHPATDNEALPIITAFATGRLESCLPSASRRLLDLVANFDQAQPGSNSPRMVSLVGKANTAISIPAGADGPPPNPIVSKSQLNSLRHAKAGSSSCTILDFDPLELARQFTIIESKIFCAIQPEELLDLEWTKKRNSLATNVRAMSTLSTDLANLVADTILQLEEPKKRAVVIKQWIKIAKKCLELNNYDSLMAIICSLNSSMILRLKKTWDCMSPKTMAKLEDLKTIVDVSRNYAVLRQRLQKHVAPCLPFVGIYLTDLTFVDAGNQMTRQLPHESGGECVSVINFDKYLKTAKIIGELQRFQIPYRLTPVPEMQDWMETQIRRMRTSDEANVQSFYRRSLRLEPRDCLPPQIPTSGNVADSVNSSFSSTASSNTQRESTRERFEFWSARHFPSSMGSRERVGV